MYSTIKEGYIKEKRDYAIQCGQDRFDSQELHSLSATANDLYPLKISFTEATVDFAASPSTIASKISMKLSDKGLISPPLLGGQHAA